MCDSPQFSVKINCSESEFGLTFEEMKTRNNLHTFPRNLLAKAHSAPAVPRSIHLPLICQLSTHKYSTDRLSACSRSLSAAAEGIDEEASSAASPAQDTFSERTEAPLPSISDPYQVNCASWSAPFIDQVMESHLLQQCLQISKLPLSGEIILFCNLETITPLMAVHQRKRRDPSKKPTTTTNSATGGILTVLSSIFASPAAPRPPLDTVI